MSYKIQVVRTRDELRALLPEWKAFLTTGVLGRSFYNDPDRVFYFLEESPSYVPFIVVMRNERGICCIAPFFICVIRLPIRISVIKLFAIKTRRLTLFGSDFLCACDEDYQLCFPQILDALHSCRREFDLVLAESVLTSSNLWLFLTAPRRLTGDYIPLTESPVMQKVHEIRFPASYDEFFSSLSSNKRKSLLWRNRKLLRELSGKVEFARIVRPEQVESFLNDVDVICHETWQAKTFGYQQQNSAERAAFCKRMANNGWLRCYLLRGDGVPIAFQIGYQYNGVYYCQGSGYAQSHARLSPGTVLKHMLLQDLLHEDGPTTLDFGYGDLQYKQELANVTHNACNLYITFRNRWRQVIRLQRGLNVLYMFIRSFLVSTRLDNIVRRWVKHKK